MRVINWFEIPVTDMPRARAFYERVLEVSLREESCGPDMEMCVFPYADPATGGALCRNSNLVPAPGGILIYLNAGDDLSLPLSRVEAAGGAVVMPKTLLSPEIGAIAIFRDSEGNHIGLHSPR